MKAARVRRWTTGLIVCNTFLIGWLWAVLSQEINRLMLANAQLWDQTVAVANEVTKWKDMTRDVAGQYTSLGEQLQRSREHTAAQIQTWIDDWHATLTPDQAVHVELRQRVKRLESR